MDCVIVSVPFTDTIKPLLAPALLKAQVVKAGFTAKTYDLNAELRSRMLDHKDWSLVVEFYKTGRLDARIAAEIEQQIVHMADRVLADRPRVVAISVFTYDCRWATRWLAWEIRRRSQSVEILLDRKSVV